MNLAAPAFLLGLAALALPWLLHRFSRQQPEQLDFPTDRFLEAVPPPVSKRQRLRHLVLFALRWLGVIVLCLLFARVWFASTGAVVEPRTLHLVVLDRSFSMRADNRFEAARAALDERLADLPAGDRVRVYAFDDALSPVGSSGAGEQTSGAGDIGIVEARALLSGIEVGYGRSDYGVLMRGLDAAASRAALPAAAIVATDLQASAMPLRNNDLFAPQLVGLSLIDVARDAQLPGNVRLDADAVTRDDALAQVEIALQADADTAIRGTLQIEHDGEVLHREPIDALGRDERRIESLILPAMPSPELDVRFIAADGADDALPEDNGVRIPVRHARATRVALLSLDRSIDEATRVFVTTALETDDGVDVVSATLDGIADSDMAVVVAGSDSGVSLAGVLDAVRAGVDVLLVPTRSRAIASSSDSPPYTERPISRIDRSHPLDVGSIDWSGVHRYAPARWSAQADDSVLLGDADGGALLFERPLSGAGRLLLLVDPLDGDASNLPFEPAFVELLSSIRRWFDSSGALPERVHVGESVALPANVQVFDANGVARFSLEERSLPERLELDEPGLYRIADARGERTLSVITDPRESALTPIGAETRAGWSGRHDRNALAATTSEVETQTGRMPTSTQLDEARDRTVAERWSLRWLLPLVVVLLVLESLLGNRRLAVRRDGS